MRRAALGVAVALALAVAYLLVWPVPIAPVAWDAPHAPPLTGVLAPNGRLRPVERLGVGAVRGPEAVAFDASGRIHTGTLDGRIVRLDPRSGAVEELAATGGRPLGMAFARDGTLYVCDGEKGLLSVSPSGAVRVVATGHAGVPFRLPNDLDVGPDGTVYFSDSSSRHGLHEIPQALIEHGGGGRLLAYHPDTGRTELLLSGLEFPNGVAVAGDGSYVAVNEMGAYRVTRYWLAGPRRGTSEPLHENLPGLPDNLTWSPARKAFWVALYSPRISALDALARHPFLRTVVVRLPSWTQPTPAPVGWAIAIDEQGRIVESLDDRSPGAYAPVASVRERDGVLWLGTVAADGIGRIPAPPVDRR